MAKLAGKTPWGRSWNIVFERMGWTNNPKTKAFIANKIKWDAAEWRSHQQQHFLILLLPVNNLVMFLTLYNFINDKTQSIFAADCWQARKVQLTVLNWHCFPVRMCAGGWNLSPHPAQPDPNQTWVDSSLLLLFQLLSQTTEAADLIIL